jgi:hypothetical protein
MAGTVMHKINYEKNIPHSESKCRPNILAFNLVNFHCT